MEVTGSTSVKVDNRTAEQSAQRKREAIERNEEKAIEEKRDEKRAAKLPEEKERGKQVDVEA